MKERFSSRLGLILSVLGIAVGTGNVWRFPRIAAQNAGEDGAGAFLVAWISFLFLWSVPLIIAEYAIGKNGRRGVIGSFITLVGEKFAWMGGFVVLVATAIMFYYSVITGWCAYYFLHSLFAPLPSNVAESTLIWDQFQGSMIPSLFHFLAFVGVAFVVTKGVKAIEKVSKILIPTLILILLISAIRAITLPGSFEGISYLFTPDWSTLLAPSIWLEALTQNAWDTGAGWGLILTYAIYMNKSDGITVSAFQTGVGNNIISLVSAVIIFSTVFGTLGATMNSSEILEVMKTSGPASTGLTFMWMPQLFLQMPGGKIFAILFFLALTFAAFTSLISMVEMSVKVLVDMGLPRLKSTISIVVVGFLFGLPSALSPQVLANQDFVWGLGLMISGALISFVVIKHDVLDFRTEKIHSKSSGDRLGKWWDWIIQFIIPIEAVVLLGWWIYRSATEFSPDSWYDPFDSYSVATCVLQWAILISGLILFNKKIAVWSRSAKTESP